MKSVYFFLGCLFCCTLLEAQSVYKGVILDATNSQPIAYVNIGILARSHGTVSNEKGLFDLGLELSDYSSADTLQFSSLGYKTVKKTITDLQLFEGARQVIRLEPEAIPLEEVVLSSKRRFFEEQTVGYPFEDARIVGYWKDNVALGGELATKINVKKGYRRLKSYSFHVLENPSDSLLLRINIYKGKDGIPKTNISQKTILHLLKTKNGRITIDLIPYNLSLIHI